MSRTFLLLVLLGWGVAAHGDDAVVNDWATELARAHRNSEAIPVLSTRFTRIDSYEAYHVQAAYVQMRINFETGERVSGYKAAATSATVQKAIKTRAPMGGVMFESGESKPGATLKLSDFGRMMIEVELGYRLNSPVSEIIIRIQDLKKLIAEIVPVIELPDTGYTDRSKSQLTDHIAANALASGYLVGSAFETLSTDPNAIYVTLSKDGVMINDAHGNDAMDNQWEALHWLVNHTVAQGYTIGPGDLLVTGLLGQAIVAEAGDYEATFGEHESIRFRVE
jgi:2-keto-4-pentenoate hydratase